MPDSIHIIGSKASGGAERFYARLINSLSEKSRVLAINPSGSDVSELVDSEVPQRHLPLLNNQDFYSRWLIRHVALKNHPVIVQSYMGRATHLTHIPQGKGAVHIARLGGYYNLKSYRHAHHLIGNTKGICDYLIREGVPAETVHYIGNFVEPILPPPAEELAALRASLNIPDNAFVITCAARFHPNKGLPDLLEAFSKHRKKHPEARLILVGDGPLASDLRKQIQTLEIEDAVILPGWRDPRPYYHLADVLTCPSRHEPLGNTILEAWACGKPLVATQTQGASELITDGQDGLITPLQDTVRLADTFEQLLNNPALCASLAKAGVEKVRRQFGKQVITNEYLNLYKKLLGQV
ncbi:MAG: glycosyltransferase [Verrucomicrobia bacterium]|nr:glycosyltransferase [Verrucomicrobiota bacterium]